ncbi:hypothetical protein REDROCK_43 [Mycobacterium phage RedRock]|uniref:Uncharacterized protein n=1 Tax=Mycobacterium phage RedRock TaxID=711470 RepID=D3JZA5_9CAUD|nr:hypothetical protein REDROCK_43 [Mycobacterium phage RedRock]YP_009303496.1 hypothetical protein SEA_LOSER_43 [Mycobacterium phage Loser]ADB93736.1 hypothetical protein REDROCK_43 [Mycobacterium phage RedRock]AMS00939.1 hypothetical protein SEA_LOSER_43 [Mycobacterium phage Loser]
MAGFGLNLQWHGEGDGVKPEAFRPIDFKLTLEIDNERIEVHTTATPDIKNDPQQMRWHAHKLWDSMVDALTDRNWI